MASPLAAVGLQAGSRPKPHLPVLALAGDDP